MKPANGSQRSEVRCRKSSLLLIVLCHLLSVLCNPSSALAADRITASITITNGTTNGMKFIANAVTRTWTNEVYYAPTQVLATNDAASACTNLLAHLYAYPVADFATYQTDSNTFRLDGRTGVALSVSGAGDYFSVTYSTQTVTTANNVLVPYTAIPSGTRPTITGGLVDWLNLSGASALYESANSVSNLVGRTNAQSISGAKTFTGANIYSNASAIFYDGTISNAAAISGNAHSLTGGVFYSAMLLDPIVGTMEITNRLTFGAATDYYIDWDQTTEQLIFSGEGGNTNLIIPWADGSPIVTPNGVVSGGGFTGSGAALSNVVNLGTITNQNWRGTNLFPAGADVSFGRFAVTSLADGNNAAVPVGTNVFVEVSGPTSAFTICGVDGQPSRDGKLIILLNQTGQNMTIAHDSGTDPVAANRILSMTGGDRATTGNGSATLIYSGAASRWILLALDP